MSGPPTASQPGDARLLRRVRWRLVAWSAGSTLVLLLVLGSALYLSVDASLAATGRAQLDDVARGLHDFVAHQQPDERPGGGDHGDGGGPDDSPFGRAVFGGPASGTVSLIVDESGSYVGPAPSGSDELPVRDGITAALAGETDVRVGSVDDTPVRVLSEPVDFEGERYVIQVVQDRTAEARTLTILLIVLVVGGLAVLAVAAAFGFLYAGRALVPIRESLRRQREFAADASHELRTPLTVVRASVEDLRRHAQRPVAEVGDALTDIEAEVEHLTTLVDDLLLLARSDSGAVELQREPLDLAELTGEGLQRLRALADARGVTLRLDAAPARVHGDPERLRQLVTILVHNAIRHTPPGGTVTVRLSQAGSPLLAVEDTGPGIRDEDLPHVFDRFWRAADAPAGGTGLGLSIASWIVERHGGSISAANRREGGARFVVQLPAT